MSATALAEYLILQPEAQEAIIHDSRFSRPPIVAANRAALSALRKYNTDPYRDKSALAAVKASLTAKAMQADIRIIFLSVHARTMFRTASQRAGLSRTLLRRENAIHSAG